jgi:hypothetical protein
VRVTHPSGIPDGWLGVDIGPASQIALGEIIKSSKTIIWNGPPGVFEMPNFSNGTRSFCEAVAAATALGAHTIAGGGDTATAAQQVKCRCRCCRCCCCCCRCRCCCCCCCCCCCRCCCCQPHPPSEYAHNGCFLNRTNCYCF